MDCDERVERGQQHTLRGGIGRFHIHRTHACGDESRQPERGQQETKRACPEPAVSPVDAATRIELLVRDPPSRASGGGVSVAERSVGGSNVAVLVTPKSRTKRTQGKYYGRFSSDKYGAFSLPT